jgi:hypothetical protein
LTRLVRRETIEKDRFEVSGYFGFLRPALLFSVERRIRPLQRSVMEAAKVE